MCRLSSPFAGGGARQTTLTTYLNRGQGKAQQASHSAHQTGGKNQDKSEDWLI